EEAVARQRRRVGLEVLLADNVRIVRQVGVWWAAEPAAGLAHGSRARGFALAIGVALAEQRLDDVARIGVEGRARAIEALLVEAYVVPLAHRILGLGVGLALDQGNDDV